VVWCGVEWCVVCVPLVDINLSLSLTALTVRAPVRTYRPYQALKERHQHHVEAGDGEALLSPGGEGQGGRCGEEHSQCYTTSSQSSLLSRYVRTLRQTDSAVQYITVL
jgi:hypothetical protein